MGVRDFAVVPFFAGVGGVVLMAGTVFGQAGHDTFDTADNFMSDMGGMSGMASGTSGGLPALALIFVLLLVAFTVHDLNRRAGVDGYFPVTGRPFAYTAERLLLSPAVVKGCQVATGVIMAFTLIIII